MTNVNKVTGILCDVYRAKGYGDCTNNGISSKYDAFVLVVPDVIGPFSPNETCPALYHCYLNPKRLYGHGFPDEIMHYAFPFPCPNNSRAFNGYMFGGNWLFSSDSRFPSKTPIRIMDRKE